MRRLRLMLGVLLSVPAAADVLKAAKELPALPALGSPEIANEDRLDVPLTRVTTPPRLDGVLNDRSWQQAPVITRFMQIEPDEGTSPSEATTVQLLYDDTTLYVGIRAWDSHPEDITASQMQRDADLDNDDHVTVILDPFLNFRDGYLFRVNPLGAKEDALIFNGVEERFDWDGIWIAETHIDDRGWSAELAIPFATLSFNPSLTTWGFNMERRIARRNELIRWATPDRDKVVSSLQDAGRITDIAGLDQGLGLRVKPFAVLRARRNGDTDKTGLKLEPGFDLFYQFTPSITGALTVNTDFAETEVDERQVNLTRFPLFFPEKRDFFLQDAGLFSFGGILESPLPFFSRRIGLDPAGNPIDLIGGLKLTGRTEHYDFGFLSTRVDAFDAVDAKTLSVARLSSNVSDDSSVGLIATQGDPLSNEDNTLLGADYHYRSTNLGGRGKVLDAFAWGQYTHSSGATGGGEAFGLSVNYPNEGIIGNITVQQIDESYNPALGFVFETGIRETFGELGYLTRPPGFGDVIPQFDWLYRTNLDNQLKASTLNPEIFIENRAGDFIFPEILVEREQLFEPFEILPGIVIPPGDYRYERYLVSFGTSLDRPLDLQGLISTGPFFDGTRQDYELSLGWRPGSRFNARIDYEINDLELPAGRFTVHVARVGLNVNFSPRLIWNTIAQFDNVSEDLGLNSRLRWTLAPGRDLFLVLNHGIDTLADDGAAAEGTAIIAKLNWNFLF